MHYIHYITYTAVYKLQYIHYITCTTWHTLHYNTIHYITYSTLHCIALHYITYICNYMHTHMDETAWCFQCADLDTSSSINGEWGEYFEVREDYLNGLALFIHFHPCSTCSSCSFFSSIERTCPEFLRCRLAWTMPYPSGCGSKWKTINGTTDGNV